MNFRLIATSSACIALAAIVYASVVPSGLRPHIYLPGPVEHVIGYGVMTVLVAWALSRWQTRIVAAFMLMLLAGLLELSQILAPGRDSQLIDFLASSIGIVLGLAAFAGLQRLISACR